MYLYVLFYKMSKYKMEVQHYFPQENVPTILVHKIVNIIDFTKFLFFKIKKNTGGPLSLLLVISNMSKMKKRLLSIKLKGTFFNAFLNIPLKKDFYIIKFY